MMAASGDYERRLEVEELDVLSKIAFRALDWVNAAAHNDYARSQMLRAVWYTLYGEDLENAQQ